MTNNERKQGFLSLSRIGRAFIFSLQGLRHAAGKEAAFQQELLVITGFSILCIALPFSAYLKVQLLVMHILVLVVELLNSSIEALADKVCQDQDGLIKQAKDMGSAAVFLVLAAATVLWVYAIVTLI